MSNLMTLYDGEGQRLYLTPKERQDFIDAAVNAPRKVRTLCHTLVYTGCRISEALALPYGRIDLSSKEVIILSLKKRKKLSAKPQYRAVPVPDYFIDALSLAHGLRERKKCDKDLKLWTWTRQHAARLIKAVMQDAGIDTALPHANPKGLRHTFGIHAVLSGVPVTEIQLLMGHSDLKTTALYLESFGKEKRTIVAKMW